MGLAASILFGGLLLVNVSLVDAQDASTVKYRPLEFLVGSCWIGTFPDGKRTDEHCFEWVFEKAFIRDRHVVRGGEEHYEGESLFRWDSKSKRLAFWYWNNSGGVSEGVVEHTAEGIVFPERHTTDTGVVEMRAVWSRTGTDRYRVRQAERSAAGWKTLWTMDLRRR